MKTSTSKKRLRYFPLQLVLSLIAFAIIFIAAIMIGAKSISLIDVRNAIFNPGVNNDDISIIRELRLPREVGGVLVGAALGVAGAIMQGLTRNPLADPGLLGLSAGASMALAAVLAFAPGIGYFGIMVTCFVGAAIGVLLVFGVSAIRKRNMSPMRMVLAGAAVSALLTAIADGISLQFKIAKSVSMWTSGGLIGTTWGQIQAMTPVIVICLIVAIMLSRQLTILSLSESTAVGLGLKTTQIKIIMFILIILLAGTAVALVGNLAFVGLMIPHFVRMFSGTDYRTILPLSAILGAAFMVFADTMARMINAPYETPLAAIIAIIGLPFFLIVVRKGVRSL
ncbi:FecCD family ABC transporter permease [Paenibacillus sp. WLX1005]|uniref:FecCD family ABC transporter permease n=1 Tax=unclassified Paenibacillus TaxID=185978 RepID=UPI003983DFDF